MLVLYNKMIKNKTKNNQTKIWIKRDDVNEEMIEIVWVDVCIAL